MRQIQNPKTRRSMRYMGSDDADRGKSGWGNTLNGKNED